MNSQKIELHEPSIAQELCMIQNKNTTITIMPLSGQIRVNGMNITGQTTLKHQDRVFFSANNVFVLHNPVEERLLKQSGKVIKPVTFEMAQNEIGEHSNVQSKGYGWFRDEIAETLILTHEANAIALELNRGIRFEPVIVPAMVLGDKTKHSKASILILYAFRF
ncbi:kinesin-like protein unc-104 [Mercenaria mercenaria]|uniref:kinesin-like protein unc-104 n=1 Tax=Mercenaria mercenaria TaxID=6596 RepID=UPI00234EA58C|nr:kinesin-like protein unc-104 [Mercenaria mercenaria]